MSLSNLLHAIHLVPLVAMVLSVIVCPYTKVEESFHMQAAHDFLYVHNLSQWDHHEYPGVVPRSFVGAAVMAGTAAPVVRVLDSMWVSADTDSTRMYAQYAVRIALAVILWAAMSRIGFALNAAYPNWGMAPAIYFSLMQVTSFHLTFYSSRPLGNTFALAGASLGFAELIYKRPVRAFLIYGVTAVVFRADSAMLAGALGLFAVFEQRSISLPRAVGVVLASVVAGCAICIPVDSVLWRRPFMFAELEMLHYNVVLNKSSNWGTSPFHWYFTSALPKAMLTNIVMLFFAWRFVATFRVYTKAALLFVVVYSILPHKELRFIIYVLPMFHAHIALLLSGVHHSKMNSRIFLLVFAFGLVGVNVVGNAGMHYVSSHNYPGGYALKELHRQKLLPDQSTAPIVVHLDTLVCMTGATRFGKMHGSSGRWTYSKDPYVFVMSNTTEGTSVYEHAPFTHVVASTQVPDYRGRLVSMHDHAAVFSAIGRIDGLLGIDWHGSSVKVEPKVGIFEKRDWNKK
eukprot:PhM_4_TR13094/c0_g2_i1/m.5696/K03847/ALG12; alpha-1,6-mannosyltransferase